jgi:hypothetical protein
MTKILVALGALMFAGFGVNGLLRPASVLEMMQASAGHATTLNEVRAMYGGFELGVAAFLVACLLDRWSIKAGLFLMTSIFAGAVVSRALSMAVDGAPSGLFFNVWYVEIVFAVLGVVALWRERD